MHAQCTLHNIYSWVEKMASRPYCHICAIIPPVAVGKEKKWCWSSSSNCSDHLNTSEQFETKGFSKKNLKSGRRQDRQYRWERNAPTDGICPKGKLVFTLTCGSVVHLEDSQSYEVFCALFSGGLPGTPPWRKIEEKGKQSAKWLPSKQLLFWNWSRQDASLIQ